MTIRRVLDDLRQLRQRCLDDVAALDAAITVLQPLDLAPQPVVDNQVVNDPAPVPARKVRDLPAPRPGKTTRRQFPDHVKAAGAERARTVGVRKAAVEMECAESVVRGWMGRFPASAQPALAPVTSITEASGTVVCPECPATFKNSSGLASHRIFKHDARPSPFTPPPAGEHGDVRTPPGDDPAWPYKCSCGRRFPTMADWRDGHRKPQPQAAWKLHRLIEQPKATMIPTGIPSRLGDLEAKRTRAYEDLG